MRSFKSNENIHKTTRAAVDAWYVNVYGRLRICNNELWDGQAQSAQDHCAVLDPYSFPHSNNTTDPSANADFVLGFPSHLNLLSNGFKL